MVITRELTNTASASTASDIQLGSCVTEIGRGAFSGYTNLGEVEFPDGLTTIGEAAFSGSSVSSVEFPSSLSAISNASFSTCSGLTEVTIPSGVTSVGNYAFSTCSNISSCTVDSASIGSYAFRNCNNMQTINLGSNVSSIGTSAFTGSHIIKLSIEATTPPTLSGDSLYGSYLIYVPYLSYNDYITNWSSYRNRIVYDDFPYKVQFFGSEGIENIVPCNSSTTLSRTDVNTYITSSTTKVVLGNCVSSIGNYAFYYNTQINEVEWSSGITSIDYTAFYGLSADFGNVTFDENVTMINFDSFLGSNSFNNLTIIGNSSTTVGSRAFYGSSINNLTIGSGITSLSDYMFYNTSGYSSLTIPSNITSIGGSCFYNSKYSSFSDSGANEDLREVIILGNPTVGNGNFNGIRNLSSMTLTNVSNIPRSFATDISGLTRVNSDVDGKAYFPNLVSISAGSFCDIVNSFEELEIGSAITSFSSSGSNGTYPPFSRCDRLKKVHIVGNSNTVIDNFVFKDVYRTDSNVYYCDGAVEELIIDNAANIGIRSSSGLTKVTLGNGVTSSSIPSGAFSGSTDLTEINLPSNLTSIPNAMFSGCTSLSSIAIPSGVTSIGDSAFTWCGFSSFEIPSGITTIGNYAFSYNRNITTMIIPSNVLSIGTGAFSDCSNLTSIMMSRTTPPVLGANAFDWTPAIIYVPANSYELYINAENWSNYSDRIMAIGSQYKAILMGSSPKVISCNNNTTLSQQEISSWDANFATVGNCVTEIGERAFVNNHITGFSLSSGVTTIGNSAFAGSNLVRLDANSFGGVETIGYQAFSGCSSLTSCTIGSGVTSIGTSAFNSCYSLTSCTIGSGVTSIGDNAFYNCRSLTSIEIPNSVTSIGNKAFQYCSGLTSCTIGDGVTSIGDYAFYYCSSLTSIDIPNSVTSIGNAAFGGCSGLTSINIPSGVTSIGYYAFYNCISLTSCTIGSGVTSIGQYAFDSCTSLTSVTVNATTPPTLGGNVFASTNNCPIYVPAESVSAYQSAWSRYASRIQAIPNS